MKKIVSMILLFAMSCFMIGALVGCGAPKTPEDMIRKIVEKYDPSEDENISEAEKWKLEPESVELVGDGEYHVEGDVMYKTHYNDVWEADFHCHVVLNDNGKWVVEDYYSGDFCGVPTSFWVKS